MKSIEKYMCTMKLIDETVNAAKAIMGKPAFLPVSFFSRSKFEIPQISRIGTIVRIHRGDTKSFKGAFQLNCDSGIKAAWVLFDPQTGYAPLAHTKQSYTFIENDKRRLAAIRSFGQQFFTAEDSTECTATGPNVDEVDTIAMLLKRKEKDDVYDRMTVFDGERFFKVKVPKSQYTYIGVKDVVKIRGLTESEAGGLVVNDYTNIMKVNKEYSVAVELVKKVKEAKKIKSIKEKLEVFIPVEKESRVLSEVLNDKFEVVLLRDIASQDLSVIEGRKFRIRVNILEIGPKKSNNWIIPITEELRRYYDLERTMEMYYKFQLFAKDYSNAEDRNVYLLYLCSIDGKGKEFLPASCRSNPYALKRIYKLLTKPWFHLDLIVEAVISGNNVLLFIVDTKLNI
eukprot:TRINITY_DN4358_c0_g1_i13.p1 TRINITY_DN4358_c0_g1~~TRINITY_DN4358_c0_g1_i13.p1  ORF type:complete len:398 (+),score=87.48 TRINITY_DN4358_c0_g1_i13:462-1655(+)